MLSRKAEHRKASDTFTSVYRSMSSGTGMDFASPAFTVRILLPQRLCSDSLALIPVIHGGRAVVASATDRPPRASAIITSVWVFEAGPKPLRTTVTNENVVPAAVSADDTIVNLWQWASG